MTYEDARRILGVHAGVSPRDIAASFRRMARKYHPDHNRSPDAARAFQTIVEARDTLLKGPTRGGLDPALEAEMNARIHEQRETRRKFEEQEQRFRWPQHQPKYHGDLSDFLNGMLGGGLFRK